MNIVICETSDSKIWNVGNFVSALANASRQGAVIVDMNAEGPCLTSINFEQIVSSISGLNIDHIRSNWHNQGVMVREMDVIRQQEGW